MQILWKEPLVMGIIGQLNGSYLVYLPLKIMSRLFVRLLTYLQCGNLLNWDIHFFQMKKKNW